MATDTRTRRTLLTLREKMCNYLLDRGIPVPLDTQNISIDDMIIALKAYIFPIRDKSQEEWFEAIRQLNLPELNETEYAQIREFLTAMCDLIKE